jgi:hypothetical protein
MKRYRMLKEKAMAEYKAWYSPSSDKFMQFSFHGLHSERAEEDLKMKEPEAIKKGYIRISVHNGIYIESFNMPNSRDFLATREAVDSHTRKNQPSTIWDVLGREEYWEFTKDSFFNSESITDGVQKK